MTNKTTDDRAAAADIAFRRRALAVNAGIYARRHAPRLMPMLVGTGVVRARYIAMVAWLGSEGSWSPEDARRLATLAEDIARLGRGHPDADEAYQWHADRMRELVRQHAALADLEKHLPHPAWPAIRERHVSATRRRASARAASRTLRA